MAFLPRICLEKGANVMYHRTRDDLIGKLSRVYSYAMMLYAADPYRRGDGTISWAGTHEGLTVFVGGVRRNVLVVQCVYSRSKEHVGWYIFSYNNVAPPPAASEGKRNIRKREESYQTLYEKARDALYRRSPREMDNILNGSGSELAGRVRERLMAEYTVSERAALYLDFTFIDDVLTIRARLTRPTRAMRSWTPKASPLLIPQPQRRARRPRPRRTPRRACAAVPASPT